jgi:hypothetical protein
MPISVACVWMAVPPGVEGRAPSRAFHFAVRIERDSTRYFVEKAKREIWRDDLLFEEIDLFIARLEMKAEQLAIHLDGSTSISTKAKSDRSR